ncbi:MAG: glutamine amidotransferase family protein [Rhodospirillales bacterium]
MCGIVGLYIKNPELTANLGRLLEPMLIEMSGRGPDSAGVAFYRDKAPDGWEKVTLFHRDLNYDWAGLAQGIRNDLRGEATESVRYNHCTVVTNVDSEAIQLWLANHHPEVRVMSVGNTIEIYKDMGLPKDVAARFRISELEGTHALGHTRMATESAVTTEHSHPFSTGEDLCLVHNGSMSNHNRMRQWLRRHGDIEFQTDNDTEVAAGYFTYRLRQGATLREALEAGLKDLDGFYTFAIGTRGGFAVMRDPIAAKPAVLAETDDWVAMASEYCSIAPLPGAENATIWEPAPATMYTWGEA